MTKPIVYFQLLLFLLTGTISCKNDKGENGPFITDENFYNLCLELYDTDGDGVFTRYEASLVTELILNNGGIRSLEGIVYFTALEYLDCTENYISAIDMSANPGLKVLNANFNPIETLDVRSNPLLEQLWCTPRDLTEGKLSALDLSGNPRLKTLVCNRLGLTSIDLSANPLLSEIYCSDNKIPTLEVSHCTALTELQAASCGIAVLNLPPAGRLVRLNIKNNNIKSLDMAGQSAVVSLACGANPLTVLENIRDCRSLVTLGCSDCSLMELNVSDLATLRSLYCQDNSLTELDISGCNALWTLNCDGNLLTEINTAGLSRLETFYCRNNLVELLDLRTNTALRHLYCTGNENLTVEITQQIFDNLSEYSQTGDATFRIE
ncbi:MAG: hypothetical protein LUE26_06820 [Alistipes sp.]|nr:hypothetical protein [Alistipes sp.]